GNPHLRGFRTSVLSQQGVKMSSRHSLTTKRHSFLFALLVGAVAVPVAAHAQPAAPAPAKVPEAVAIPRPSADEIETARRALEQFRATADAETKSILEKYPGLIDVRPPLANTAIIPNLARGFRQKHEANKEVAR